MSKAYEISKWSVVFETADSRRHKMLSWISLPVSFSSHGYESLLEEFRDDAPSIYGTWCALCKFAAQCPTRGRLADSQGRPIPWSRVARTTGFPIQFFDRLVEWAARPDIAWLVPVEPGISPEIPNNCSPKAAQPVDNQSTSDRQTSYPTNQTQPDLTNPTNQPTKGARTNSGGSAGGMVLDPWKEIADRLVRLGASRWKQSIHAAQQHGCSPEHALQLIEHAVAKGFGVGAVIKRLEIAHPEMGVEKGWPDRSEKLKQAATKRSAEDTAKAREAEATAIVRAGRAAKQSDEKIDEILKAKGLEWPR